MQTNKTYLIVLNCGFVYVGELSSIVSDNQFFTFTKVKNIRRWGTTKNLGELIVGPTSETVLDDTGTIHVPVNAINHVIECAENHSW